MLHGRVFAAEGELAWWRLSPDRFECRHLTAGAVLPFNGWQTDMIGADAQHEHHLLHGLVDLTENNVPADPPTWSDARIPRYMSYPVLADSTVTRASRVVLETQMCVAASGQRLQRLVGVRLAEEA